MKTLHDLLDERTAVGLTGLSLMAAGFWFVYAPLAAIVPGALLFGIFFWPSVRGKG